MSTTIEDIERWFDMGVKQGATHMIVVYDTFEWEDYPVYVMPNQDVHEVYDNHNGPNMTKVMEVYSLGKNKIDQLASDTRVFNFRRADD